MFWCKCIYMRVYVVLCVHTRDVVLFVIRPRILDFTPFFLMHEPSYFHLRSLMSLWIPRIQALFEIQPYNIV